MMFPTVQTRCRPIIRALLCAGLLGITPVTAQPRFEDVTPEAAPFHFFESLAVSFGDYNNDGWPDLFFAEAANFTDDGGDRVALLHNGGKGRFYHRPYALPNNLLSFDPKVHAGETLGAGIFGDYDRDGDLDLYLPLGFWFHHRNRNVLMRNDRGHFTNVTEDAQLSEELSSSFAIWLDYDRDGYLDLYVSDHPAMKIDLLRGEFADLGLVSTNRLYRNNGNGTFTEASETAGLADVRGGFPMLAAPDVNDDGWPDIYIGQRIGSPNKLFLGDGQGHFGDATTEEVGDLGGSNGLAVGDIDNDGDLDLFQPTSGNFLPAAPLRSVTLLNLGDGEFLDITETVGLSALAGKPVRGAALTDLDNDGDLDLVTGRPTHLFLNNGEGLFTEATAASGLSPEGGFGMIAGDYDRDGCIDLVYGGVTLLSNELRIYRNTCNDYHYLRVELVGIDSNRNGIGARINVLAGTLRQTRELLGGVGYIQNEPVAHFGLGDNTFVDTLEVRWPSGRVDIHTNLPVDQQLRIFEGQQGYHISAPTRWEHEMPDSIEVGETMVWESSVQPALFSPDAGIERVTADLSAWGGAPAEPLALHDDGTYRLARVRGSSMETTV